MPVTREKAPSGGTAAGGPATGGPATGTASGRRRQLSTLARLRRLLATVLAAIVLFWIAATILQQGLQAAAHSARDALSPAYQDAAQMQSSLSDADLAAWQAFRSGAAQQTGPGLQYQNDIANAGEALERLAALQAPGSAESSQLQTISGQLVTYQNLVEQADAENRRDVALGSASHGQLGLVFLTYASNDSNAQGGLLDNIDTRLVKPGQQALHDQLASPWADRALPLAFVVPALLTLAAVAAAQMFLRRRFNRAVSLPLLLAAAVTCGLAGWLLTAAWHADSAIAAAKGTDLPNLTTQWQSQTNAVEKAASALATGGPVTSSSSGLDPSATQAASSRLDADLASAENAGGLPAGIPVLAAATAVLCYAGFRPRLNEYRAGGGRR